MPPTERKGRVHTSTVTVAVFEVVSEQRWQLKDAEIKTMISKASGPGGQHVNKTETCVVMRHIPTGIEAKASSRSQLDNKRTARTMLESRVADHYRNGEKASQDALRKAQVGSGMRGDKVRTYREQDDLVTDHRTGKKARLSAVVGGRLGLVW